MNAKYVVRCHGTGIPLFLTNRDDWDFNAWSRDASAATMFDTRAEAVRVMIQIEALLDDGDIYEVVEVTAPDATSAPPPRPAP